MEATLNYTVKKGDGYLAIARFIFSKSSRAYIQGLVKNHLVMKEAAISIEADLKHEYHNFKLTAKQSIKLHADPSYYVPRLALVANHGELKHKAKVKAVTTPTEDYYFVIHSTVGNMSDKKLESKKKAKIVGAGHAYVKKDGGIVQIWPYNNSNGWATKAERPEHKPELRGKLVNIELVYADGEEPTEEQYEALADIYIESNKLFNKKLPIAAHREIDRGIKGGHEDPKKFKFNHFYSILEKKKVDIKNIKKQSQSRFDHMPRCDSKWQWPPVLTGTTFPRITDKKKLTAKGCK